MINDFQANNPNPSNPNYERNSRLIDDKVQSLRIPYLRKLYFMLFLQWLIVGIITFCAWYFADFKSFLASYKWIGAITGSVAIGISLFVLYARRPASRFPLNWIFYLLFTAALALTFAWFVAIGNSDVALMVFISAGAVSLSLFIYALTTKTELSYQGPSLFVLGAILLVFQIFLIFTDIRFDHMIFITMGEIVWSFYLIYDTQTIVSGAKYDWSKDDWVGGKKTH
jgi:protein lifeguard